MNWNAIKAVDAWNSAGIIITMRLTTAASIYVYKSPEKLSEKIFMIHLVLYEAREKEIQFFSWYPAQAVAAKKLFMFGKAQQLNSILIGCILV